MSLYRIVEALFYPYNLDEVNVTLEQLRNITSIYEALGLLNVKGRKSQRWYYIGPKIYSVLKRQLFKKYQEKYNLREVSVGPLDRVEKIHNVVVSLDNSVSYNH